MVVKQVVDVECYCYVYCDVYVKSYVVIKGWLIIFVDLLFELVQGIFVQLCMYEIVLCILFVVSDIYSDVILQLYGFVIKIIGVQGEWLIFELGGSNQDVLMVNFLMFVFGIIVKYD